MESVTFYKEVRDIQEFVLIIDYNYLKMESIVDCNINVSNYSFPINESFYNSDNNALENDLLNPQQLIS